MRGRNNEWVQDEGLALYLLLDRFVVNWQERLLSPDLASPTGVLAEALRTADPESCCRKSRRPGDGPEVSSPK
jgi:hypothetical protein